MDEDTRLQIQKVLSGAIEAIMENNPLELVSLSNLTIHNATTNQGQDAITIAVLSYSLSKIYQRPNYKTKRGWDSFNRATLKGLNMALTAIQEKDYLKYEKVMKAFFELIDKLDKKLRKYIQSVMLDARINKASRLYEHGISLGRTAELLGITQYELMNYAGATFIADTKEGETRSIAKRIGIARSLFE